MFLKLNALNFLDNMIILLVKHCKHSCLLYLCTNSLFCLLGNGWQVYFFSK